MEDAELERGFGLGPLFVLYVLLPHQSIGLMVPVIAGWYYDKYHPRLLRPLSMALIALGIFLTGGIGLAYEYTFSKLASDLLGNSARQWAIIIAVMMLFMGIGADIQKYFRNHNLIDKLIMSGLELVRV